MTQVIAKMAAKRILGKELEKYKDKKVTDSYDPYYTLVDNPRKPGKKKKVKKLVPDYIPEHDAIILAKMRQRAYWLDMALCNFLGIRFGWSSLIGIIPGFGDVIDAAMALLLVYRCSKISCGLGSTIYLRMIINVGLDFAVGLVPILGDLADAMIRANTWNVRLLEKRLDEAYRPGQLKKSDKEAREAHRPTPPPATVYEDFDSDDESRRLPMHRQDIEPRRPDPARVPQETRGGERSTTRKGTLKKSDSRRKRGDDLEMAQAPRR